MANPFDMSTWKQSVIDRVEVTDKNKIFSVERSFVCIPTAPITHVQVCNNVVITAMTNNAILRVELDKEGRPDEIEVSRVSDDRVHNIFLDPTGRHLIISMQSAENFYLSRSSKKARPLNKAKGHLIDSVGWNRQNTEEGNTREILVGTNEGFIFETQIVASEESKFFTSSVEQYWKQIFNVKQSVTGIEFEKMPSSGSSDYRYFVLVTTPARLYQFVGNISPATAEPPIFHPIFAPYENAPGGAKFTELPGSFGYSDLKLYHPKYRSIPDSFAWMTGPGIYYGKIDGSGYITGDTVTCNTKLINYPVVDGERSGLLIGLGLTQFHVVIAYTDRLKAVCVLNDQIVFSHLTEMELQGKIMGICRDSLKGTMWLHTDQALFEIKIREERRNVWQIYLDLGEFNLARQFCQTNEQKDTVLIREAEHQYAKEEYLRSAEMFAKTSLMFEEVALKYIHLSDKEPLKSFLLAKVNLLARGHDQAGERAQLTLLSLWLCELFLDQLGRLKDAGQMPGSEAHSRIQKEFRQLLTLPRVTMTLRECKQTVYDLIDSHGNVQDMVFFADLMKDYDRVVRHHIHECNYEAALQVITSQPSSALHYLYGPTLITHMPERTLETWIKMGSSLQPHLLLPALLQARPEHSRLYLELAISSLKCRDQNVHNLLISVYANAGAGDMLLRYLKNEGTDPYRVPYDPQYAMRVCAERGHVRCSVHLHSMLGMYHEAVEDALKQNDITLAKEIAESTGVDDETKKQLWLRIARHVVEKEKDIKEATKVVHECPLLKLEDILPFFPDFVTIDHFKDAICESLDFYNKHIETLKADMKEATASASDIRNQIQAFRLRYAVVKLEDVCAECKYPLLLRTFYLFPCGHYFHTDCLANLVKPHLSSEKLYLFDELTNTIASGSSSTSVQNIRAKYDDLIASDCVFCGQIAIDSVDQLFFEPLVYDEELASWR